MIVLCNIGTNAEVFNPQVLYALKCNNKDSIKTCYHCHKHAELSYVLSGTTNYTINNSIYKLKKGDFIIFNPGVYHEEFLTPGEQVSELHMGFDNLSIEGLPKNFLLKENSSPVVHLKKYRKEFDGCIHQIISEQAKNEPGFDIVLKSLSMNLLVLLLRETYCDEEVQQTESLSFNSSDKSTIVRTIIAYMNEKYTEEISLDKMAKTTYLSPVYISKIFKEETGYSPINYLINIRLQKAKQLLESGNSSVKAAAESVGYNDAYYFSKLFKKYYGYPPSKISAR
ncbi:AraC family transcriptional regulator [Clostridium thermarum]|uniref:AraC family transcriptional regulator n=1 Tax=Clostridium thermarum TaxID=1716543 RepID=UPI001FABD151|nr:AraC family transcriptional regulator [Clostridium thermarum]